MPTQYRVSQQFTPDGDGKTAQAVAKGGIPAPQMRWVCVVMGGSEARIIAHALKTGDAKSPADQALAASFAAELAGVPVEVRPQANKNGCCSLAPKPLCITATIKRTILGQTVAQD